MVETNNQFNNMMPNPDGSAPKPRYLALVGLLVIILIVAGGYAYLKKHPLNTTNQNNKKSATRLPSVLLSSQIINQGKGYPAEYKLENYGGLPNQFPNGAWFNELQPPAHADVITRSDGQVVVTVIYDSSSTPSTIVDQEKQSLTKAGWVVNKTMTSDKFNVVGAFYGGSTLVATIVPQGSGSQATIQVTETQKPIFATSTPASSGSH